MLGNQSCMSIIIVIGRGPFPMTHFYGLKNKSVKKKDQEGVGVKADHSIQPGPSCTTQHFLVLKT